MDLPRNIIQGASGGIVGGALVGLAEACWLLATTGAPDLVAPLYGVVLYGLIGLGIGMGGGVALSVYEKLRKPVREPTAWAFGFAAASFPLLAFIGLYLANKVIFAEQGVPLPGKVAVAGGAFAYAVISLWLLQHMLAGGLKGLLRAKGLLIAWGGPIAVTAVLAALPLHPDPRDGFAGKPMAKKLADKPDIIVIMVDTLRGDALGTYGGTDTPNFDAFAADSVVFDAAYAQASWTRSSTASLWTSRIPSGHNAATKAAILSEEVVTWAEVLQQGGYTTGALVNNINVTETFGFDQGFDTFLYEAPAYRFGATESVFGLTLYKVVHKLAERLIPGPKVVERYYQPASVVLDDARAYAEANPDGRYALFVHLMEPHDPYFEHPSIDGTGPEDYNGVGFGRAEVEHPDPRDAEYLERVYLDEVRFLDREIGPYFAWLKEQGRYDDALIVVTSDHGEEFHEHGGFWHGTTLYDEQVRIPLIVKLPHNVHAGRRVPWTVRSIDVAPTLAAAAGLQPGAGWEGHDLVADLDEVAAEERAAEEARLVAEREAEAAAATVAMGGEPPLDVPADGTDPAPPTDAPAPAPVVAPEPTRGHARDRVAVSEEDFEGNVLASVRQDGFKYIRAQLGNPRGLPPEELFDVQGDPGETSDLLGTGRAVGGRYPVDVAKALSDTLRAELEAVREGAVHGGDAKMTAAECERLKALGYVGKDEDCAGE